MARTRPQTPTSPFSADFSWHLRTYMTENAITVEKLAEATGRSVRYVYDHTGGLRPPDTDLLNGVATLARTDVRTLVLDLMGRMIA